MVFCGQCGAQLPPGVTKCPRCGSIVEGDNTVAELHPDDPTIASVAYTAPNQAPPYTQQPPPGTQQPPLVLRPGGNYDYGTQAAYDSRSGAANPSPYAPTTAMPSPTSHPGYMQSGGNYQTQQPFYAPGAGQQGQYPPAQSSSQKGRTTGLIFILLGLLLILSAVILLALQHNGFFAGGGGGSEAAATQAITGYYDDINKRDYQAAYALWQKPTQTFADFQNGFKNTQHDALAIDNTTVQSDGTVKFTVTVTANEVSTSGSKTTTYKGYYVMGKQSDGTWKIVQGALNAA